MNSKLLLGLTGMLISFNALSAPVMTDKAPNLNGLWINQRGSTLEIKQDKDQLSGKFVTAVAKTPSCLKKPLSFLGYANNNTLSLSVNMTECNSPFSLSMSGIVMTGKDGQEKLKTQALIQHNGKESWDSQILTSDYYTRVSK